MLDAPTIQLLADKIAALAADKSRCQHWLLQGPEGLGDIHRFPGDVLMNLDSAIDLSKLQLLEDHHPLHGRRCTQTNNHGGLCRSCLSCSIVPFSSGLSARFVYSPG